jgi:hypothetical protein
MQQTTIDDSNSRVEISDVNPSIVFGKIPISATCGHCRNEVVTVVGHTPGLGAWLAGIVTVFTG